MEAGKLFNILDSIDSTNNYAMAQVHAGLAQTGMVLVCPGTMGRKRTAWTALAK